MHDTGRDPADGSQKLPVNLRSGAVVTPGYSSGQVSPTPSRPRDLGEKNFVLEHLRLLSNAVNHEASVQPNGLRHHACPICSVNPVRNPPI